ncbi:MAG: TonB-dependent receptor [Bacteroidales bacterium]|nr:TonB-dependent receptor [Bacteroidales bacterium]
MMNIKLNVCSRFGIFAITMMIVVLFFSDTVIAQVTISGIIIERETGNPLPGAHISVENNSLPTVSDKNGRFLLTRIKPGVGTVRASFIGYKTFYKPMLLINDTIIHIAMEGSALLGDEVNIIATRAQHKYPTAYSSISNQEISAANLGRDIPYLIQNSPSTIVTSDAGNGIGYTGISIRGTDLTRINVTVNSIPLNDAESQGVWFVDLPDMASSTENIQIQRGVGTSTNGAGAFGASINFMTTDLQQDPYGELNLSGGSYNTFKTTLRFGTGLMANKFSVDGRLSYIHSDGYIDRSFSNLKSYYLAGGYFGKNTTIRLITFSGFERTYQAWEGVPKDSLAMNRTYNPAGEYTNESGALKYYDNQTDNYQQDHYQLLFSQLLTKQWNFNTAIHYTKGKGYYENFKQDAAFGDYGLSNVIIGNDTLTATDLINRKMLDNDFYGITFSTNYTLPEKFQVTLGGAWNRYKGQHFGKVIWAEYASNGNNKRNWYYNTGLKNDLNIYGKASVQMLKKLSLFADLQYRHVSYTMKGTLDDLRLIDQEHLFNFFNPKGGLFFEINKQNDLFFSVGVANREPSRNNYKDADPGKIPTKETLYDYELGYSFKHPGVSASANLYYMDYRDQLALTGEINNVGEAIMVNVPHSYRAGIELGASAGFFQRKLLLAVNATLSKNRIRNFTHYIDAYDQDWNPLGQDTIFLGETDLSFSPNVIMGAIITYKPIARLSFTLNTKYIGKQYIDNTSNEGRSLKGYLVNGISAMYSVKTKLIGEIGFNLTVNNLFNRKYETNAWVYPYYLGGTYNEYNGYFPQALINFLFGISVKI